VKNNIIFIKNDVIFFIYNIMASLKEIYEKLENTRKDKIIKEQQSYDIKMENYNRFVNSMRKLEPNISSGSRKKSQIGVMKIGITNIVR